MPEALGPRAVRGGEAYLPPSFTAVLIEGRGGGWPLEKPFTCVELKVGEARGFSLSCSEVVPRSWRA